MAFPTGVPPGSRVTTCSRPISVRYWATRLIWVDLPAPSGPSNTMNESVTTGRLAGIFPHGGTDLRPGSVTPGCIVRPAHVACAGCPPSADGAIPAVRHPSHD